MSSKKLLNSLPGFLSLIIVIVIHFVPSHGFAQLSANFYSSDRSIIASGQSIFQQKCAACHNFRQQAIGPELSAVTATNSVSWLTKFISNSQEMVKAGDKRAVQLFNKFKVPMPPNPDLGKDEMRALLSYIHSQQKKQAPANGNETAKFGPALDDPIPEKIKKSDLTITLKPLLKAPATAELAPVARINQMTRLTGKEERIYLNDLRGVLYRLVDTSLKVVFDIRKERSGFIHNPGHANGLGSYAFHPDFEKNGLFYTTHTEKPSGIKSDFTYPDSIKVFLQWIVTEWKIDNPLSDEFKGSSREFMRIDMPSQIHGMQQITFNPLAKAGSTDYGMLYIGIGDGGMAESGYAYLCNSLKTPWSTVLRIDPTGTNSRNKKYGIPADNPYASSTPALPEIFARGFRNPNRIAWSPDGKMLVCDIGLGNIEELNIAVPGGDYGWPFREGNFLLNYKGKMNKVYKAPPGKDKYRAPVIQYDHDEGNAISPGFVYEGKIEQLRGKYIFGDIVRGRVFYVDAAQLKQGTQAIIREFNLVFDDAPNDFLAITGNQKADLRFGIGAGNELYFYTKSDGRIWRVDDCK